MGSSTISILDRTGQITLNIVRDYLDDYKILLEPKNMKHRVSWATTVGIDDKECYEKDPSRIVYVLSLHQAQAQSRLPKQACTIVVLSPDEPFDQASNLLGDITDRAFVVREKENKNSRAALVSRLQSLFFTFFQWHENCQHIIRRNGSIQELFDEFEKICGNWCDMTDATYRLVAYSHNIKPDDPLSIELLQEGCHNAQRIDQMRGAGIFKEWHTQQTAQVFAGAGDIPFTHMAAIIRFHNRYYGHVVMVCNHVPYSDGMYDYFSDFVEYCHLLLAHSIETANTNLSPYQDFIKHLLDEGNSSPLYIENQMGLLNLDKEEMYRLTLIDCQDNEYSDQPLFLISILKDIVPNSFPVLYNNQILIVTHTDSFEDCLGLRDILTIEQFCKSYGCRAYRSGLGNNINDLPYLYKQCEITKHYSPCIKIELHSLNIIDRDYVVIFEDAFNFFCCDISPKDEDLMSFCVDNTLLDLILKREQEQSVPDIKLLYTYLSNECRATPTAELLHMHRNNIVYRINGIQQRYCINLDRVDTRHYLLNCYRIKILHSVKFRNLIS